jgi:TolB-like protein/DNA-binding winged helix-turn-helix (wHTH) protein/Tfp pilus assembly protein PilF
VNLAARELRKHGVQVRLPGQPFCILSILLEKPGEVVSREEIRAKLWTADVFVDFEHSLNSAMKKLRAALGDSPENSRYIETLPRQGYRFIAPVEEISAVEEVPAALIPPAAPEARATEEQTRRRRWPWLIGIAALFVLIAGGAGFWAHLRARPEPSGERLTMAVLPFENLTGDNGQDYLSDGLTEEITAQLGRLDPEHLGVIARTSVMHYKHGQEKAGQIARELGVQYLLEGSVRREADRVRITAQLIQMKDETRVWSRQYDRQIDSLLALETEIAQETSDEIQLTLGKSYKPNPALRNPAPPTSYAAYDLYLRGRYFWNKRTPEGFRQAATYFQQSVDKDPQYAPAYAGLADTYALMSSWMLVPQKEYIPKARAAALRALELNDGLAEAHTSLALVAENYDYDWQTAEKEYRRAIALDPQYATAHQWYAECLSFQGRFPEALAESERARQLDPLSLIIAADHAVILYYAREYDRAIEQFRAVRAMEPDFPRAHMMAFAYLEKGMLAEASEDAENWKADREGRTPTDLQALLYARTGDMAKARQSFAKWRSESSRRHEMLTLTTVEAMVALGQKDEALAALTKGYREHSNLVTSIKVEPGLDPLRSDERFQELLRRTGLAQ